MKKTNRVEVIKKSVDLLKYLSSKNSSAGVTEIARYLAIPKSTTHRILLTLCEDNVVHHCENGQYRMGPTVLLWSSGYRFSSGIVDIARPWLERLRDDSRETLHLSVYEGGMAQYVDRVDSPQTVVLRWSRLGTSMPLYCTAAGRAILAALPADEVTAYLDKTELEPRTANTEKSPVKLVKMLARFRVQGYAEENQENEENIRCIGGAILNHDSYPVAAISLTAPAFRFNDADAQKFGGKISAAARAISAQL
ncbi:MAG: IclR family transcriptional regulator [Planctomycetota bacterium]|jgi:DNA-binding IclR family transcriptional regulator|nr:IclR family transcriptional regulator [Planctomycetota bacterium]